MTNAGIAPVLHHAAEKFIRAKPFLPNCAVGDKFAATGLNK